MSITRYIWDYEGMDEYENGRYVIYEDHAELMADLQQRLDETEALLAEAQELSRDIAERLERAEEEVSDLQSSLYTYTESDQ